MPIKGGGPPANLGVERTPGFRPRSNKLVGRVAWLGGDPQCTFHFWQPAHRGISLLSISGIAVAMAQAGLGRIAWETSDAKRLHEDEPEAFGHRTRPQPREDLPATLQVSGLDVTSLDGRCRAEHRWPRCQVLPRLPRACSSRFASTPPSIAPPWSGQDYWKTSSRQGEDIKLMDSFWPKAPFRDTDAARPWTSTTTWMHASFLKETMGECKLDEIYSNLLRPF